MVQSIAENTENALIRLIPMTREERLLQVNNGSLEDRRLEELILAVWARERGSFTHKRAIRSLVVYAGQLFKQFFKFNSKWKNYAQEADPVYSRDVEFDALVYLSLHIEEFVPKGSSIKSSLKNWIEFNAINKGIDRYRSQERKDLKPLSSDIGFKGRDKEANIPWEIGDDREEGLDAIFSKLNGRFRAAFLDYLQKDPEGKMEACSMKKLPQCNCYILVQFQYFREPKLNLTQAALELAVNEGGLRSHWTRTCLKLLKEIAQEVAKSNGHELD